MQLGHIVTSPHSPHFIIGENPLRFCNKITCSFLLSLSSCKKSENDEKGYFEKQQELEEPGVLRNYVEKPLNKANETADSVNERQKKIDDQFKQLQ